MEFSILGPLEVRENGRVLPVPGRRPRALLAFLLLRANEAVPFDELVAELWGETAPTHARASLQNQASALRRLLGADRLVTVGSAYSLRVEPGELDLDRFAELVAASRNAATGERSRLLGEALALWRGLPLVEFPSEPFAQAEIARLEELRLAVVEDRIAAAVQEGRVEELVPELEQLVARHPLHERLWGFLMLALYRSGRQAEALAAYRRARAALVDGLGLEPGRELKDLQRRILLHETWSAPDERDVLREAVALFPTHDRGRARVLLDYAFALRRLGEKERALDALAEAERLVGALGDPALAERARLLRSEIDFYDHAGDFAHGLAVAEGAAAAYRGLGDLGGLAAALCQQGRILRDLGRCAQAAAVLEESVRVSAAAGDGWQEGMSRNLLGTALLYGPTPAAEAIGACEAHLAALEWGPPGPIGLRSSLGVLLARSGRVEEGRRLLQQTRRDCRAAHVANTFATHLLADVELAAGNRAEGERLLREAHDVIDALGDLGALGWVKAVLAHAIADAGPAEAEQLALEARGLISGDDIVGRIAWHRALSRVRRRDADGRRLAEEAVSLCEATDILDLQAATLEDLAAACRAAGDAAAERDVLGRAEALYERKGNTLAAARVQALLHGQRT